MTEEPNQVALADELAIQLDILGIECNPRDLLDSLGCAGLELRRSREGLNPAGEAYVLELTEEPGQTG